MRGAYLENSSVAPCVRGRNIITTSQLIFSRYRARFCTVINPISEPNLAVQLCAMPLVSGIISSLLATAIIGTIGFFIVRRSLYKRINDATNTVKYAKQALSSLAGARSFVDQAQQNISAALLSSKDPQTAVQWMSNELTNVRNSINAAESQLERLSGGMITLKNIEDKSQ